MQSVYSTAQVDGDKKSQFWLRVVTEDHQLGRIDRDGNGSDQTRTQQKIKRIQSLDRSGQIKESRRREEGKFSEVV